MARTAKPQINCVMDASVLIAVFNNEPYDASVPGLFDNAVISTYNIAEAVNSVLNKKGGDENVIWSYFSNFVQNHYNLDDKLSFEAIKLTKATKSSGLSLGDKYCLALAKLLNVPVYTADRAWKNFEDVIGVQINLIR